MFGDDRKQSRMCEGLRIYSNTCDNHSNSHGSGGWFKSHLVSYGLAFVFGNNSLRSPLSVCQSGNRGPVFHLGTDASARANKGP